MISLPVKNVVRFAWMGIRTHHHKITDIIYIYISLERPYLSRVALFVAKVYFILCSNILAVLNCWKGIEHSPIGALPPAMMCRPTLFFPHWPETAIDSADCGIDTSDNGFYRTPTSLLKTIQLVVTDAYCTLLFLLPLSRSTGVTFDIACIRTSFVFHMNYIAFDSLLNWIKSYESLIVTMNN
jgi:hypothetical protein